MLSGIKNGGDLPIIRLKDFVRRKGLMTLQFDAAPDEMAVFLEEADEQLQLLDQDIVLMEKEGPNPDLLQKVFRAAHTLKGSSAAIGHERMASLTHAMETALDFLRKGALAQSTTLIDLLLQSLDALRILKEEVVTLEYSGLDTSGLVESLRQFLEAQLPGQGAAQPPRAAAGSGARAGGQPSTSSAVPVSSHPNPLPAGEGRIGATRAEADCSPGHYTITVHVVPDSLFPVARLLQVYLALSEAGKIIDSTPSREEIEGEYAATALRISCLSDLGPDALKELVMAVPELSSVRIENGQGTVEVVIEEEGFYSAGGALESKAELPPGQESGSSQAANLSVKPTFREGDRKPANKSTAGKTVRIDIERLDALMNLVGELVIDCTRLVQLSSRLQSRYEGDELGQMVGETSQHIQRITDELQDRIMRARMFPVGSVFNRFPRMVRDLAQRVDKKIEFIMEGEETELDRSVIEEISDPLTHLLRNAVDHGVEPPGERVAAGKPESGLVRLQACHRENRIVLTVEDDGKGIDPERIRRSAVEKGLCTSEAAARLSDREAIELVFAPGFSTATDVSDLSGRGVGMDIVRTNIHKLNGTVQIQSSPGQGSQFILELPLTLAIMDALLVSLESNVYAIPLASVTETLMVRQPDLSSVNGHKVIQHRGQVLPLVDLGDTLRSRNGSGDGSRTYVVVVSSGGERVGIVVGGLIGEQQVVVKSLGNYVGDVRGLSGATILGDGKVALILDVPALVKKTVQERGKKAVYV